MNLKLFVIKSISGIGILFAVLLTAGIWLISFITRIIVGMAHKIR